MLAARVASTARAVSNSLCNPKSSLTQRFGFVSGLFMFCDKQAQNFFLGCRERPSRSTRDQRRKVQWDRHQFAKAGRPPRMVQNGFALRTTKCAREFELLALRECMNFDYRSGYRNVERLLSRADDNAKIRKIAL